VYKILEKVLARIISKGHVFANFQREREVSQSINQIVDGRKRLEMVYEPDTLRFFQARFEEIG
jgi:tryptophanase